MADGTITFSTDLDNAELEKQLQSLKKDISKSEDSVANKKVKQLGIKQQLDDAKASALETETTIKNLKSELNSINANTSGSAGSNLSPDEYTASIERKKEITAELREQEKILSRQDKATESIDKKYIKITDDVRGETSNLARLQEQAGGVEQQLVKNSSGIVSMSPALNKAQIYMDKFTKRVSGLMKRVLVFSMITMALRSLRNWMGKIVKTNSEATAAISRLKGAMLTLAQPIAEVVIPVFTFLVNVLTTVINAISKLYAWITGKSIDQTRKSAEALYGETDAIASTGNAAEKAKKQLAGFDEINQLSSGESGNGGSTGGSTGGATPDFSGDMSWMKDMTGQAAGWVTAGLLLGGIFFIVAGICTQNIKMVIGGVLLLGAGIAFGVESGTFENWWDVLGLPEVSNWIVPALLLVGIGLIVFGILLTNVAMLLIGAGLLGAGIAIGEESGTFQNWWDVLGLPEAQGWVTAAILIGGMGMLVFGIVTKNILLMVLGVVTLGIGVGFGINNGTLQNWWDVLCLPQVSGWITTSLLLVGIGLLVFGIFLKNIRMIVCGVALLGVGITFGVESGTFEKWWEVLCLPQVSGWVTAALLLGGMGLLIIGIATGNLPMLIAGLALLGGAITFGITSGTFKRWITSIGTCLKEGWQDIKSWWNANVAPVFTSQWWNDLGRTIMNGLISGVESGINWVLGGVGDMVNGMTGILNKIPGVNIRRVNWGNVHIPRLGQGAVIPPNREFMAVLGDQHHGTNVEAPLETIQQAVAITMKPLMDAMLAFAKSGGGNIALTVNLDGRVVYENVVQRNNAIVRSTGESPLLT